LRPWCRRRKWRRASPTTFRTSPTTPSPGRVNYFGE
jgi:hypothetical protein